MIDAVTQKRLRVTTAGTVSAYISVPLSQLNAVTALLDANRIGYWVDDEVLSIDEKPEVAFINLADASDSSNIQRILDSIP